MNLRSRKQPTLSEPEFRARLAATMDRHAAAKLPLGAQSHFEIITPDTAPKPTACACCKDADDSTGFRRGSCVGSPTLAWGCGHSFRSHFANYLDEVSGE